MKLNINRWIYVIIGGAIMFLSGLVYAWSVLAMPIAAEFTQWSKGQLSLTFTICMITFCVGSLTGGLVSRRINIKYNILASAILLFVGFMMAAKTTSLIGLYIGYGVLAGFGSGVAYNAVMDTLSKWFPDKQGLISGLLLMIFCFGSFTIGKLYQAYTPAETGGWRSSFTILGVILLITMIIGGILLSKPGKDFCVPAAQKAKEKKFAEEGIDVDVTGMMKRVSFWLFFAWATLLTTAGLALIGQATGVATQVGQGAISGGTIATVVGLISIFNGIGRLLFGALFDKIGRKMTMLLNNVAFLIGVCLVLLSILTHSFVALVVGFVVFGLSYGGISSTNSAFANSFYGATHYSVNFSVMNMNLLISSFGGTVAGILYDATGSYFSTLILSLVLVVVATISSMLIRKP